MHLAFDKHVAVVLNCSEQKLNETCCRKSLRVRRVLSLLPNYGMQLPGSDGGDSDSLSDDDDDAPGPEGPRICCKLTHHLPPAVVHAV